MAAVIIGKPESRRSKRGGHVGCPKWKPKRSGIRQVVCGLSTLKPKNGADGAQTAQMGAKAVEQCAEYPNQGQRGRKEGEWFVDGLIGVENEVSNAK